MTITERAAYIKGLAEGLGIDESTKEGKVIKALIDAFDDMALTVSDLEAELDELTEQVETIDEDLGSLEEDYYDLDDECDCDECGAEDFEDGDIYEVCCPTCGDIVCIDSDMLEEGQTTCPNCGELLEFDLEDDGEETEDSDNEDK
ncbi:CD1247 N-terminal domain-containing protein [Anaerotruncus massiliensis (ex Togo et al. 2019)]|uniref:CD1247 N-terminal domain-containing protein n=1 Tax=Anaerotruncus TaxID=244127 RepID=UPI000C785C9E|nr:CD1247 N-terminal domain-containing protein [Anaerotruncus massiliensis (ex Togo et al. 2019)]